MGITGAGVLVSNIDTGVEGGHPALASRWAGVADSSMPAIRNGLV